MLATNAFFKIFPFIFFGFFFVFTIIIIVTAVRKNNNNNQKMEELTKNNDFVKKHREKYENIVRDYEKSISSESSELHKLNMIVGIVVAITFTYFMATISFGINGKLLFAFIPISIVLIIICEKKSIPLRMQKRQKTEETIKSIIKEYDNNLEYYPTNGYKRDGYDSLYFAEDCDRFTSEDLIVNNKTGFCCADILVESRHEDDDGNTYYSTEYDGSLAKIDIKDIGCTIILGGLGKHSFIRSKEFQKIMFENDEFNKIFLCFTNNEFTSYKILTPDIMEEFIRIRENMLDDIDIRIINDKLYIRFSGTNGFDSMGEDLFKSMAVLEEIMKTMDKIKNIIESKVIN